MSRRRLLLRLLIKAAWVRKDRAFTALISVAVVATIATAALTIYGDLEGKLSREFRGFGANVVVSSAQALDSAKLETIEREAGQQSQVVPVAYAIAVNTRKTPVVIGGTDVVDFRELNSWWSMRSGGYAGSGMVIGSRAAAALSPKGGAFDLVYVGRTITIEPEYIFNSGSEDDSRIYLPLNDFVRWTGVKPTTALVRVEGRPQEIHAALARLSASLPGIDVKPLRRITHA